MALPTYSTGTVAVTTGGAVTVTGGIWSGTNVVAGDMISVAGGTAVLLSDVTLAAGQIAGWTGGAVTGQTYVVYQGSSLRFEDVQVAQDLQKQVAALNTEGFIVFVAAGETAPDPSLGDDNQWATQPDTGSWWQKTGGLWVASSGPVRGYGGTSTTSLAIGTGSKVFTTQTNLAFNTASRVRAYTSAGGYVEGRVTAYSGTTLTINADAVSGTGTYADWTFSIIGQPGNMTGSNNGSEFTDIVAVRNTIHAAPINAMAFSNIIVNGDPVVAQEHGGAYETALTSLTEIYIADHWTAKFNKSSGSLAINALVATTAAFGVSPSSGGFQSVIGLRTTTGAAMGVNDYAYLSQKIEGYRISRLGFMSSAAQYITIGFWVYSSVPGTYGVALRNSPLNSARGYVASYTISAAATWEYKTVSVRCDTTGTWTLDNGFGLHLIFAAAAGTNACVTPGSWQADTPTSLAGTANAMATTNNLFCITGVSMFPGLDTPAAAESPNLFRPFDHELALCQRDFRSSWDYGVVPGTAWTAGLDQVKLAHPSGSFSGGVDFPNMRAAGTLTIYDNAGTPGVVTIFDGTSWVPGSSITTQLSKQSFMWVQHTTANSKFTNFGYKIDARL